MMPLICAGFQQHMAVNKQGYLKTLLHGNVNKCVGMLSQNCLQASNRDTMIKNIFVSLYNYTGNFIFLNFLAKLILKLMFDSFPSLQFITWL